MDHRTATTLALRLTGVAILVLTIPYAPNTFLTLFRSGVVTAWHSLLLTAAAEMIPLLCGLALVYFPARIGTLVVGRRTPDESAAQPKGEIGEVAVVAVGLYYFASGILDAIYYLAKYWLYRIAVTKEEWSDGPAVLQDDFAGMISVAVQLVVGAVLIFSAPGLYRFIQKVRRTTPKNGS